MMIPLIGNTIMMNNLKIIIFILSLIYSFAVKCTNTLYDSVSDDKIIRRPSWVAGNYYKNKYFREAYEIYKQLVINNTAATVDCLNFLHTHYILRNEIDDFSMAYSRKVQHASQHVQQSRYLDPYDYYIAEKLETCVAKYLKEDQKSE